MEENEKFRILLVEDSEPERREFAEYMRLQPDVEVIWCVASVAEDVQVLLDGKPNVVLLDWMLGENEHGDDFLEEVRKLGKHRPTIFVASNISSERTRKLAANTGLIEDYFLKTVPGYGPTYVMQKIRRYTGRMFDLTQAVVTPNPLHAQSETAAELAGPELFTLTTLHDEIQRIVVGLGLTPGSQACSTAVQALMHASVRCHRKGLSTFINMEKEIYSRIYRANEEGEYERINAEAVRSNLRTAVGTICSRADRDELRKYCPNDGGENGTMEVKQFVLTFAANFHRRYQARFPVTDYLARFPAKSRSK